MQISLFGSLLFLYLSCTGSTSSSIKNTQSVKTRPGNVTSVLKPEADSLLEPGKDAMSIIQYQTQGSCNCYFKDSCGCICRQPITWEEFQILPQNFRNCPGFTLALRGGEFHSFPGNYFYRVANVRDFVLDISAIDFQYLLDPSSESSPFNRVSFDTSALIRIHRVNVARSWNWGGFYDLTPNTRRAYCEVNVVESAMSVLAADFGAICRGAVTVVKVNHCGLVAVENRVFVPFYKLNELDLSNNRIRVILRSYFARPAYELEDISLENNDIRSLPSDAFTEMPSLRRVNLRGNPITTLEEPLFRPIFSSVEIIGLESLPLTCDCRAKWLKERNPLRGTNFYGLTSAVCQSPPRLQGQRLFKDTSAKDFTC